MRETKTMSKPASSPGSERGKKTVQKARDGVAPKLEAAFIQSLSIARIFA